VPLGLSDTFARDAAKQGQWQGFLNKNRLSAPGLENVITEVWRFVEGPLRMARQKMRGQG